MKLHTSIQALAVSTLGWILDIWDSRNHVGPKSKPDLSCSAILFHDKYSIGK